MTASGPPPEDPGADLEGTVSWRELLAETTGRLQVAHVDFPEAEARWIIQTASGLEGTDFVLGLDDPATVRGVAHLDAMVARRLAGEPVQHVLGSWSFRTLDLLCDSRALIPRPETEQVVDVALAELHDVLTRRPAGHRPLVVDLGTGTGCIALAIAVERPKAEVWATELSPEALAVARANLAGLGMAGSRVRLVEGSWFEALPADLAGTIDLIVTNPPYIAEHEDLPPAVTDWEPASALFGGPDGLQAYRDILDDALGWLAPGGSFVAEIGHLQGPDVLALAEAAGLVDTAVHQDHAGLDRTVVGRKPG